MSHNGLGYRVYPDNEAPHTIEQWRKADEWINGMKFKKDFNEAISIAKLGVENCKTPFVVQELPIGGKMPKNTSCWVFG